jgi:hypothetical protein
MNLSELQSAYRAYLISGDPGKLASTVVEDSFDATERLRIYRNNFLLGLGEALNSNFPVVRQMVGEDFFAQAARAFILRAPPSKPCLFEYGEGFPEFLADLPEMAKLPYVAEMAQFEFARIAAYHAPVEALLTDAAIARVPPEKLSDLPIRLARHVRLLPVRFPILDLWQAHQASDPDLAAIDMNPRPHTLLICRPQRTLVTQRIEPAVTLFLSTAMRPTKLAHAAEACGPNLDPDGLGQVISLALQHRLLVSPR